MHECCGVFGIYAPGEDVARLTFFGLILGVIGLGFTIGAAIGPFLAGYIFDVAGSYQVAFLICAAISIVGLILAAVLRPTKRPEVTT